MTKFYISIWKISWKIILLTYESTVQFMGKKFIFLKESCPWT